MSAQPHLSNFSRGFANGKASIIQNLLLDCAGQNNRFGLPDCSINATLSLDAALHFGGFREHCPGLVQGNLLFAVFSRVLLK